MTRKRQTNEETTMTTAIETSKKITVATVKAFIRKNRATLNTMVKSGFDGMQDCVVGASCPQFKPATAKTYFCHDLRDIVEVGHDCKYSLGVKGVYFVGQSGNWCKAFENDKFKGYEVYNCCGNWIVAVAK
jgi:hypothetical protein